MPPLPDGAKQPKVEMPDKYSGANDHQEFYQWLDGVLNWMRSYNLCGPDADAHRLQYLRQHLSKEAADWYTQDVDHPSATASPMFEDTICALHTQFVHSNTAAKATEDFAHCTYSYRGGVEKFAEELKQRAKEMIVHPNEYEMRVRLITGLPKQMAYHMQVHRGLSAEYCSWGTILEHARQLEDAYRQVEHTPSQKTSIYGAGQPNHNPSRPKDSHPSGDRRDRDRSHDHNRSWDHDRSRSCSCGRSVDRRLDRREHTDRKSSKTRFPPRPPTPGPAAPKDNACFACSKVGHFKGDPQCPKSREAGGQSASAARPKPRFHAQRVESEAANSDFRNGWGGSQYSEGGPPEDPQDGSEGEDEGSEILRAHAMRVLEQEQLPTLRSMRVMADELEDEQWHSCEEESDGEADTIRLQAMRTTKSGAPIEF